MGATIDSSVPTTTPVAALRISHCPDPPTATLRPPALRFQIACPTQHKDSHRHQLESAATTLLTQRVAVVG